MLDWIGMWGKQVKALGSVSLRYGLPDIPERFLWSGRAHCPAVGGLEWFSHERIIALP